MTKDPFTTLFNDAKATYGEAQAIEMTHGYRKDPFYDRVRREVQENAILDGAYQRLAWGTA